MRSESPKEFFKSEFYEGRVAEKIKLALENAMTESRFSEIHEIFARDMTEGGMHPEEKKVFEAEMLRSTVVADTLLEYKEVLLQAESLLSEEEGWAMRELAHENSHANVGQSLGFEWGGYALLFVKDEEGHLLGVNPHCILRPQKEWTDDEYHTKSIEMLDAPRIFGETLSSGDIDQIEIHKKAMSE